MKLISLLKPASIFLAFLLLISVLFNKGLIGQYLKLFNKGYRLEYMEACSEGYKKTHQYFLAISSESINGIRPIENNGDDIAIYYFVPVIQNLLHVKTVVAYRILLCSIILAGYTIATIGITLLFENRYIKLISYFYLALFAFFCLHILEVYVFDYFLTSFIPLLYWIIKKYIGDKKIFFPLLTLTCVGVIIGIANQFRSHSGTGMLLIMLAFLLFETKISYLHKFLFITAILLSMPLCKIYLASKINERNNWLTTQGIQPTTNKGGHMLWHQLYLGLGFTDNNYGIIWDDKCGYDKAKAIDPTINMMDLSTRDIDAYEAIIKNEYLEIVKNDFFFVIKTFLIKFVYVFLFFILFFNFGLSLLKIVKLNYRIIIPLSAGIGFYFLPGILVYPLPFYFLGALNLLVICELLLVNEYYQTKMNKSNISSAL